VTEQKEPRIAAQIVLEVPAKDARDMVAANVHTLRPSPEVVRDVTEHFARLGFTAGPCVGNSFSIEGPQSLFERVFKVTLSSQPDGGVKARTADAQQSFELPRAVLPSHLRSGIRWIGFTEPPAFGPVGFK
jgi:hypothetical protein